MKVSKKKLVKVIADDIGCDQKTVELVIDRLFYWIKEVLCSGGTVSLRGFATFATITRKKSVQYSVKDGKYRESGGTRQISFRPSENLKKELNRDTE